jgi:hypothetical protein
MFTASTGVTLLDHFRIPYQVRPTGAPDGLEQIAPAVGGPRLLWPRPDPDRPPIRGRLVGLGRQTPPLFATITGDDRLRSLIADQGDGWVVAGAVTDEAGRRLGSVWRSDDGTLLLPFAPDEVIVNFWSERYTELTRSASARAGKQALMRSYYRLRPLLPRRLQIWLRRRFAVVQARSAFPAWPAETCLHDFFDLLLGLLAELAGEPVPRIAAWPGGRTWALVLTHDVEQAEGWEALAPVLARERARGLRSSFNLVPRRYSVDDRRVREFVDQGFEVGVHGLYHDGRDLESLPTLRKRLPGMREAADRWDACGFRSPATHRDWDLMPRLGFDYDSSYPDTDPFEPQGGGCCTWLPFFDGEMVELPLTMAQDHTLFMILGQSDEGPWLRKAEFLRARGGLALIDTHPDYLVDDRIMRAYERFLDRFAGDETAWHALPREVSAWWRIRAASSVERDGDEWRIVGPAADQGRLEFTATDASRVEFSA